MPTDADGPDKATDEPTEPLIEVDVSRETARQAARLADRYGIAMEDALVRLTAFDYPADVVPKPAGDTQSSEGP